MSIIELIDAGAPVVMKGDPLLWCFASLREMVGDASEREGDGTGQRETWVERKE